MHRQNRKYILCSAEELQLGINEIDTEITTVSWVERQYSFVKKQRYLKTMISLLDNKQKGELV